jgi:hypothetical protein
MRILLTAERLAEPQDLAIFDRNPDMRRTVVLFEGDRNHFADLKGHAAFLLQDLKEYTKSKWLNLADRFSRPIAINVRCGNDFKAAKETADYFTKGGIKTPIGWFVTSLQTVRKIAGWEVPAVVVSDGTVEQLASLLSIPEVTFLRPGCAISDLLTLAQCKILIGSGGSSFSAWGAFLSGAPTITHPGQSLQWFKVRDGCGAYVGEFNPVDDPEPEFVKAVISRLGTVRV